MKARWEGAESLQVIEKWALGQTDKGRESQEVGAPGWKKHRRQKSSGGRGPR